MFSLRISTCYGQVSPPPSNPCLKTGLLFTPRGSSRPGTEQLWSHRAVSFRISSLSDHQQRSEDPKLKLHLFTICCLCIFLHLSPSFRDGKSWSREQRRPGEDGGTRAEFASLSEVSCVTHAPPSSFLHLINFLPVPLKLWRAAVRNGRGLWKDTSGLVVSVRRK